MKKGSKRCKECLTFKDKEKDYYTKDSTKCKICVDRLDSSGNALDGCGSVSSWECKHGRGFWGNASSGYIYDKDL